MHKSRLLSCTVTIRSHWLTFPGTVVSQKHEFREDGTARWLAGSQHSPVIVGVQLGSVICWRFYRPLLDITFCPSQVASNQQGHQTALPVLGVLLEVPGHHCLISPGVAMRPRPNLHPFHCLVAETIEAVELQRGAQALRVPLQPHQAASQSRRSLQTKARGTTYTLL